MIKWRVYIYHREHGSIGLFWFSEYVVYAASKKQARERVFSQLGSRWEINGISFVKPRGTLI